jgi:hypothetical protein
MHGAARQLGHGRRRGRHSTTTTSGRAHTAINGARGVAEEEAVTCHRKETRVETQVRKEVKAVSNTRQNMNLIRGPPQTAKDTWLSLPT